MIRGMVLQSLKDGSTFHPLTEPRKLFCFVGGR